mmetsp:Transcript_109661/g.217764  ORF Transcript_109661/g.217764 Transcript_109661/m.217764 type:complete len:366 (+) Transcript_109661:1177-2274(+)
MPARPAGPMHGRAPQWHGQVLLHVPHGAAAILHCLYRPALPPFLQLQVAAPSGQKPPHALAALRQLQPRSVASTQSLNSLPARYLGQVAREPSVARSRCPRFLPAIPAQRAGVAAQAVLVLAVTVGHAALAADHGLALHNAVPRRAVVSTAAVSVRFPPDCRQQHHALPPPHAVVLVPAEPLPQRSHVAFATPRQLALHMLVVSEVRHEHPQSFFVVGPLHHDFATPAEPLPQLAHVAFAILRLLVLQMPVACQVRHEHPAANFRCQESDVAVLPAPVLLAGQPRHDLAMPACQIEPVLGCVQQPPVPTLWHDSCATPPRPRKPALGLQYALVAGHPLRRLLRERCPRDVVSTHQQLLQHHHVPD